MQKYRFKTKKKGKKILSVILAVAVVITSIPVIGFIKGTAEVSAAVSYSPKKIGVSLMCKDMLSGTNDDDVYKKIVRVNSLKEDSKGGSAFNNVGMVGLTYQNRHGDAGKSYRVNLKSDKYRALYDLAKKGQIEQSISANVKNHNHRSTKRHWNKIKQYGKIIFGYPVDQTDNSFKKGKLFETNNNEDYSNIGGNGHWETMKPDKGYNNQLAVYLTAKKGCDGCSGAYIEHVSIALKDTKSPTISSIKFSSSQTSDTETEYFKAGQTIYAHVKFSEYVRLADNNQSSAQSANIKLGLSLGRGSTNEVTQIYAGLISLKDDVAIFSYKVPEKLSINNTDKDTDFYISGLADITKQTGLVVMSSANKNNKFNRVFLDNNGNTLSEYSSTMTKLKEGIDDNTKYEENIKRTTCAITDIAGNPVDISSFRVDSANKKGKQITRTYLDAVNPKVSDVVLSAKQDIINKKNDNEKHYLKAGGKLNTTIIFNEKLKTLTNAELKTVTAKLNLYDSSGNQVTTKASEISYGDSTSISFEPVTINKGMTIKPASDAKEKTDYKITVTDIENKSLLKDYADNQLNAVGDLRSDTSDTFYVDNEAPVIKIENENVDESKTYEMARCSTAGEVYRVVLNTTDLDTKSNSNKQPFASGVIDGKASVSIDLQSDNVSDFQYILSRLPISDSDLANKTFKNGKSNKNLALDGTDDRNTTFALTSSRTYVYLYIKFNESIDYGDVKSGIKVKMTASDVNTNSNTVTAKYNYEPKDKVKPNIYFESINLKENTDNTAYQEAKVRITDKGGININNIRYAWVEQGQSVPSTDSYTLLSVSKVEKIKTENNKVTECIATIKTKNISGNNTYSAGLYVCVKDLTGNVTSSDKLATAEIDMNMPTLQIAVPESSSNKKSSMIVNGPFTSSDNDVSMFVAIEDPANPGNYFIRNNSGKATNIASQEEEYLDENLLPFSSAANVSEISKWSYGTIESQGSQYTITPGTNLKDITDKKFRDRFLAIASNLYYGKLNIIAGTGFKASAFVEETNSIQFDATKGSLIEKSFVMMPDTYGFSKKQDVVANNFTVYDTKPNKIEISAKDNYGKQVNKEDFANYNPDDNKPEYLSSLKDAEFSITITNTRTSDFITDDINFKSENTFIKLKNVDTGYYVYQWDFVEGVSKIDITIPEELALENGHYAVEISIANFAGEGEEEVISTCTYDDIYVYDYSNSLTEGFGIDSVSTKIDFTLKDSYLNSDRLPYAGYEVMEDYNFTRSFLDEREKDYSSNTAEAYDMDTLYLGNCYISKSEYRADISYDRTIKFSVNGMSADDLDNYWIKIWTGDRNNQNSAKWFKFEDFIEADKIMTINVKPIDASKESKGSTPELFYEFYNDTTECQIPVFEGTNTVSYQIMNIGGDKSDIREVEINYHAAAPSLTFQMDNIIGSAAEVNTKVLEMDSSLTTKDVELYESDFKGNESSIQPISDREFKYTENGRHLFYAVDGYKNLTYTTYYITEIDSQAPVATFDTVSPARFVTYDGADGNEGYMENAYIDLVVTDDKPLNNAQIMISVDDREPFMVDSENKWDSEDGYAGMYFERAQLEGTGMKDIQVTFAPQNDGSYRAYVYIQMNDDIYEDKAFKEKVSHKVTVDVIDELGHKIEKKLTTEGEDFYGLNNVPRIRDVYCEAGTERIDVWFTGYVRVTKINGNEVPEKLYENLDMLDSFFISKKEDMNNKYEGVDLSDVEIKDYFGICKDGTYDIEYVDAYNNTYKDTITVENFFGNYAADISYSTVSKTNQNVVATITGVDPNAELTIKEGQEKSSNYIVTWSKDKSKAYIEFMFNDSITFELKVKGAAEPDKIVEYNVMVGNIDKDPPNDVHVRWLIKETGEVQIGNVCYRPMTTYDDVEVYIYSDSEEIYAINGKELKHTFTYSENIDNTYTFEFVDGAGNEGSHIKVQLLGVIFAEPEALVPEEEIPDTDAPSVAADVYGVYDGIAEYKTSWSPEIDDFDTIAEDIGYTGGYQIKYTLSDQSKSKIVVLNGLNASTDEVTYSSVSDDIDGVKVSSIGNSITITKECEITVVAVDESGNKVAHSFATSKFDTEKPTATVKKIGKSFTEMRILYYLDDNTDKKNDKMTIVPVSQGLNAGVDENGYYYYMDVYDNDTYNVIFKDRCGNKTTVATKVTEIDNKAPAIKVSSWSPCYVYDGKAYNTMAPTEPVNSSVTLSLDFDKTVSQLEVEYYQDGSWIIEDGTFSKTVIELGGRKGKVEFRKAVPGIVKIVATSPNGMSNELSDINLVGIIDKQSPKITFTQTKKQNSVEVIYKSDEKVLVTGCDYDTTYGAGTDIPLTIKDNGTYQLTFTDMAGNITTKSITVDSIDEVPPEIFAMGIPEDYVSSQNCKVKVTMSEKGTITFQGKDYNVSAPIDSNGDGKYQEGELYWVTLPINTNGSYQVKATDSAGLTSYKLLQVKYVDDQAPNIQFDQSVINVSQGTTVQELQDMLLDDSTFILSDNIDLAPTVSIENMLSQENLNVQGIYQVEYILKDNAGNKRSVTRYVKVISSANLKLKANGQLMSSCDTTIITDNSATITLEKSKRKGESFKIYYKEGIRKAGSMKNAKVSKNGKLSNLETGFYTLYIVTQHKETYLTYLFVIE